MESQIIKLLMSVYRHALVFPQTDKVFEKPLMQKYKPKLIEFSKIPHTTIHIQYMHTMVFNIVLGGLLTLQH